MGLTSEEQAGATSRSDGRCLPTAAEQAARKRAAVEMVARHERVLRRTARRYSLCADDAEDAYQRMLEILLTKAPTDRGRELVAWAQTVTKHEALAIRRNRERLLGPPPPGEDPSLDLIALIPAAGDGPAEKVERREAIARSREALQALKPAELRALTLLAEGYSYAEICELTGFSHTKVNRCLAEGRERFRALISHGEDGRRCEEMRPLLSAFCDGEASADQQASLREHLRACASCRSTLRAYRATPGAVVVLAPSLPAWRALLGRAHELASRAHHRLPGGRMADPAAQAAAGGGAPGAGMAALAKVAIAVCAGTGGAVAGAATGVVPLSLGSGPDQSRTPAIEHAPRQPAAEQPPAASRTRHRRPKDEQDGQPPKPATRATKSEAPEAAPDAAEPAGEYTSAPAPPPAPVEAAPAAVETGSSSGDGGAGEFGP